MTRHLLCVYAAILVPLLGKDRSAFRRQLLVRIIITKALRYPFYIGNFRTAKLEDIGPAGRLLFRCAAVFTEVSRQSRRYQYHAERHAY